MEKYNIIMYYEGRKTEDQRQTLREKFSDTKKLPDENEQSFFNIIKLSTEWWQKSDQQAEKENPRFHKLALLIICPQNDFLDGSLPVRGSKGDYQRIAKMIDIYGHHIQEISVALDAHLKGNISLASSWVILNEELQTKYKNGEYLVVNDELLSPPDNPLQPKLRPKAGVGYGLEWAKYYVRALKVADKVQLKLWPDHCIVEKKGKKYEAVKKENNQDEHMESGGTSDYFGYNVVGDISDALDKWTLMKFKKRKGKKGESLDADGPAVSYRDHREYRNIGLSRKTESYSAVLPEVEPAVNGKNFGKGNLIHFFVPFFSFPFCPFLETV